MSAQITRGDARRLPLPDASVDLIVTSPPYFALRSYTDGGQHYEGQIGSEATPAEYIAALIECTREWVRVLKPSGSIFVNLGDKYSGAGPQNAPGRLSSVGNSRHWQQVGKSGIPSKSLMMLPERYRIACVDELGLIARAVLVWSKPNGLPESVTDRVRRAHEDWVHLTRQPRYFAAVDEIREPHQHPDVRHTGPRVARGEIGQPQHLRMGLSPLGKLPGSVWEIATEPLIVPPELGVDHFAAFPTEWPRRLILGWSPSGICTVCGEGRRPVAAALHERGSEKSQREAARRVHATGGAITGGTARSSLGSPFFAYGITGYACACPDTTAPTRPGVVLDPFGGTGTTALVASVLGRHGISVDMSADYCRLAQWRTTDPGERARALRVPKPDPIHEDQLSLWEATA